MADNNLLDMLGGGYLKKLATGQGKSDGNYVPAQPSDAQRNADYAAKKLGKQVATAPPASGSGGSPLSSTMTPIAKPKGKQ